MQNVPLRYICIGTTDVVSTTPRPMRDDPQFAWPQVRTRIRLAVVEALACSLVGRTSGAVGQLRRRVRPTPPCGANSVATGGLASKRDGHVACWVQTGGHMQTHTTTIPRGKQAPSGTEVPKGLPRLNTPCPRQVSLDASVHGFLSLQTHQT